MPPVAYNKRVLKCAAKKGFSWRKKKNAISYHPEDQQKAVAAVLAMFGQACQVTDSTISAIMLLMQIASPEQGRDLKIDSRFQQVEAHVRDHGESFKMCQAMQQHIEDIVDEHDDAIDCIDKCMVSMTWPSYPTVTNDI